MSEQLVVPEELNGSRADAGLAKLMGMSRSLAATLIAEGNVVSGGKPLGKSARLASGTVLHVTVPERRDPLEIVEEEVEGLKILLDDDDFVVVDKPVGVAAHPSPGWVGPTVVAGVPQPEFSGVDQDAVINAERVPCGAPVAVPLDGEHPVVPGAAGGRFRRLPHAVHEVPERFVVVGIHCEDAVAFEMRAVGLRVAVCLHHRQPPGSPRKRHFRSCRPRRSPWRRCQLGGPQPVPDEHLQRLVGCPRVRLVHHSSECRSRWIRNSGIHAQWDGSIMIPPTRSVQCHASGRTVPRETARRKGDPAP